MWQGSMPMISCAADMFRRPYSATVGIISSSMQKILKGNSTEYFPGLSDHRWQNATAGSNAGYIPHDHEIFDKTLEAPSTYNKAVRS